MIPFPFQLGQIGFAYPPDTGGGGVGSGWNPSDKNANITLSGTNNISAQASLSGSYGVRGVTGVTTGKWYWEVGAAGITSGQSTFWCGFADSSASLNPGAINTIGGQNAVYRENGQSWVNGTLVSGGSSFAAGTRLMFAIDCATGRIWRGMNGTWLGSPSAGTGQWGTLTVGAGIFPYWVASTTTLAIATLYTASGSQSYTPPSGFSPLG